MEAILAKPVFFLFPWPACVYDGILYFHGFSASHPPHIKCLQVPLFSPVSVSSASTRDSASLIINDTIPVLCPLKPGKNYCTTLMNLHRWPVCHSDTPFCLLVKHYLISSLNQLQAWRWCPASHKVMWLCDDPRRRLPHKHASPAEWGLFWPSLSP